MSARKADAPGVDQTIDRRDFIRDPEQAFRLADEGGRVMIVSADGKARAVLSVPRTELTFDGD